MDISQISTRGLSYVRRTAKLHYIVEVIHRQKGPSSNMHVAKFAPHPRPHPPPPPLNQHHNHHSHHHHSLTSKKILITYDITSRSEIVEKKVDNIPRKLVPEEYLKVSHWHLVYPLSSWCVRSYMSFTHHIGNIDAGGRKNMEMHILCLWSTDWWILFDIQPGSHILALLGLVLTVSHSLTQHKQIIICLINYTCMLLISVSNYMLKESRIITKPAYIAWAYQLLSSLY